MSAPAVLHLAPHPDDELLGAPATLMALRDAGWRVVNLACGLGAAPQHRRREAELREACHRAGFELLLPEPLPTISAPGDPGAARRDLARAVAAALDELAPAILVSPAPGDRHPAHELVAGVAGAELAARGAAAPRWWLWGLWGPLPWPTLATGFDRARLAEIETALSAHAGELARNDYRRLVRSRAEAAACLAPELLFGFGAEAGDGPELAELLTEVVAGERGRRRGAARWLDPASPLAPPTDLPSPLC